MSKKKRRNGRTLSDAQKRQFKKDRKLERRQINQKLRDKHTYTPPANLDISQIESRDSTRLFATVPCQVCEVANCGQQSPGHESPIVIDIRSVGRRPAACAIFFSRASSYNGAFMIHDVKLNRREIDLNILILALRQLHAFMLANSEDAASPAICIDQIIIKTNSRWLDRRFFGSHSHPLRYKGLMREFRVAVNELADCNGRRPLVKFWKFHGRTIAQQLAKSKLQRWEEAQVQQESKE